MTALPHRLAATTTTVLALLVGLAGAVQAFPTSAGAFSDDDGNTHEGAIEAIAANGITLGCGSSRYCPDQELTREQMASLLVRALDLPAASADHFTDDGSSRHQDDINRLHEAGITQGCEEGAFCPDQLLSREQMATFLSRAFELPAASGDHFSDDDDSFHEDSINRIFEADITQGCASGRYCPEQDVKRDQMASFLARAGGLTPSDPTPLGGRSCDPAYYPCVPPRSEVGDLNCPDIRAVYPDGVLHDGAFGDPHGLNADADTEACDPAG